MKLHVETNEKHPSFMAKFLPKKKAWRVILGITATLFVILLIHITHALTLDRIIQYREIRYRSTRVPQDLCGIRIAFISDTHNDTSEETLYDIVEQLNSMNIDILLLGGDYTTYNIHLARTMQILSTVETTYGIFGVDGNHDNHLILFPLMQAFGLTPLDNSGVRVREGLFIAGVQDLWTRSPNIAQSIRYAHEDDFILLLTHNPDVTMHQDTSRVDFVLSGHTHGGQISFFGLFSPGTYMVSEYGQRFIGWGSTADGTRTFSGNGIGGGATPRVFARPQVVILTLTSRA